MARSRRTLFETFREGLVQKHPKAFNIFLILALISLVVAGGFLLSDIMSFKSNAAQKGPNSALHVQFPKEIQATAKNWQEKGTNLINQLKSNLGMEGPSKDAVKDAANRNNARALLAKNKLAKAKEARARTENLSQRENPIVFPNSSRTLTTVQPLQATSAIMIGGAESDGGSGSDSPSYSADSSLKDIENNHQIGVFTSNISENQLHSNESVSNVSVLNKSVMNESVMNESNISESVLNESVMNQSQMYINSSSNTSETLPSADLGSNGTIDSSYPSVPRDANLSFDNLSSGSVALPQSQMNFAASNSTEIHDGIDRDKNGSNASAILEFDNMSNEIYNQNKTSKMTTNNDDQIIKSLDLKSAPTGDAFLANNITSQFQEPKQNQTYNRKESKPKLDKSSMSLIASPNKKTKGLQNLAEKKKKKVSPSSASAKPQESKKSRLTNSPNIRTLKVPKLSSIKAGSKNKGSNTK